MKNTITTITLAIVLTFGATFANAGILVTDKAETPCTITKNDGIIIGSIAGFVETLVGIIIGSKPEPCKVVDKNTTGIIIGS